MTLFQMKVSVKRAQAVGTNGRQEKQVVSTNVSCLITPMESRKEIEAGFTIGTAYDVYTPLNAFELKAGDQLDWNGAKFNIRNVLTFELPRVGHRHALATREGA